MKPDVSCILTTLLFGHPTKYFFIVLVPLKISIIYFTELNWLDLTLQIRYG